MIELNFRTINENFFHDGLNKLASYPGFSPKEAYHISRIVDKVGQHTKDARIAYGKLIEKYAEKDEKGKAIVTQTPPFFKLKEGTDQESWAKDYEEFLDIKVQIEKNKIPLSSLPAQLGLSAKELKAVEPLIDVNEDAAETPENVVPIKK
jgi:hypothetical protein